MGLYTNKGKFRELDWVYNRTAMPTVFYVALCQKQGEKNLDAAAAADKGGGLVGIPVTAHGFATNDRIRIDGTQNYDGFYLVEASSTANEIVIKAQYQIETFTGTETVHKGPGPLTNTMADLLEIPNGNGYTSGGLSINPNATDITLTEDDSAHLAKAVLKDLVWTASGGNLPSTGTATYAVLTDDNATPSAREILAYWWLGADRVVSNGQPLRLIGSELRHIEP